MTIVSRKESKGCDMPLIPLCFSILEYHMSGSFKFREQ